MTIAAASEAQALSHQPRGVKAVVPDGTIIIGDANVEHEHHVATSQVAKSTMPPGTA